METPGSYYRSKVEDEYHDRIFIDYWGRPDIQADVIATELRNDYPGLELVEQSLDHPVVQNTWEAAQRMEPFISEPRLQVAQQLSQTRGCTVVLERLDEQPVASFKIFGPANAIPQLTKAERSRGVIAATAGNHAQGVALVSKKLGVDATIVMPLNTPRVKVEATRSHGANVVLHGQNYTDAYEYSLQLQQRSGATYVHAFDDERIMTGNAVAALQAVLKHPDMTHWYAPVGGGGFLGGTGRFIKAAMPHVAVIGVQLEGSDAMAQSLKHSRSVVLDDVEPYSDGTAVKRVGDKTLRAVRQCADRLLVVSKEQLMDGLLTLYDEIGKFAEPAGALAVTGLLHDHGLAGKTDAVAVAAVTGRNISAEKVAELERFSERKPATCHELARVALNVAEERLIC